MSEFRKTVKVILLLVNNEEYEVDLVINLPSDKEVSVYDVEKYLSNNKTVKYDTDYNIFTDKIIMFRMV